MANNTTVHTTNKTIPNGFNNKQVYNHYLEGIADSYLKKHDIEDIDVDLIYSDTDYNLSLIDSTIVMDIVSDKYYKSCEHSNVEWEELE